MPAAAKYHLKPSIKDHIGGVRIENKQPAELFDSFEGDAGPMRRSLDTGLGAHE